MPVSDYNPPERVPVRASRGHLRSLGLRSLAILALLMLANTAQAQITNPNVFFYEPDPPQADRAFVLRIRVDPCGHGLFLMNNNPLDRQIVVTPGRIDLTVLYFPTGGGVCQPGLVPYTSSIQIDPVSAGTYDLVVTGRDTAHPNDPSYNVPLYQTSVTVVEQSLAIPRPVTVPSLRSPALGLLAVLMLLLGALAWRRQG